MRMHCPADLAAHRTFLLYAETGLMFTGKNFLNLKFRTMQWKIQNNCIEAVVFLFENFYNEA